MFKSRLLTVVFMGLILGAGVLVVSPRAEAVAQVAQSTTIVQPDVLVQPEENTSVTDTLVARAENSWPWYVTRASGLVAVFLLFVLMLSGIGLITGHTFGFLEPLTAWASHRALGIACFVAILVHMFALLFDHFISFNFLSILVPFASDLKPVTIFGVNFGSLYVSLGILAFYLMIAVVLTSLFWIDKKVVIWKFVHYASYAVMAMVFVHASFLGTDLNHGIIMWIWFIGAAALIWAIGVRLQRAKSLDE